MRLFLTIVASLALALTTFVGGLTAATFLLNAEPVRLLDTSKETVALWTATPTRVDPASQQFERIEGIAIQAASAQPDDGTASSIDGALTASVSAPGDRNTAAAPKPRQNAAHVEWCMDRYRSYRAEDNTYAPYSGGRRECQSPYPPDGSVLEASAVPGGSAEYAVSDAVDTYRNGVALADDHVRACMSRYQSYRPDDNTYQPYGGGPRRQCM